MTSVNSVNNLLFTSENVELFRGMSGDLNSTILSEVQLKTATI